MEKEVLKELEAVMAHGFGILISVGEQLKLLGIQPSESPYIEGEAKYAFDWCMKLASQGGLK